MARGCSNLFPDNPSFIDEAFIQELTNYVGSHGVLLDSEDKAAYLKEKRGLFTGTSCAVVRPETTEEVAAVVQCCRYNISITPQSGNTGL